MPKLLAPTERTFNITNGPGLSADDPITVSFRQATEGNNDRRQSLLKRKVERSWANEGEYSEAMDMTNPAKQRAAEVFLTMTGCNIMTANDKPLFGFIEEGGVKRVEQGNDFLKFLGVWGKLDPEWALSIHTCCLITNATWGNAFYDEDSIQEQLATEGEGAGADEKRK